MRIGGASSIVCVLGLRISTKDTRGPLDRAEGEPLESTPLLASESECCNTGDRDGLRSNTLDDSPWLFTSPEKSTPDRSSETAADRRWAWRGRAGRAAAVPWKLLALWRKSVGTADKYGLCPGKLYSELSSMMGVSQGEILKRVKMGESPKKCEEYGGVCFQMLLEKTQR